uniref:RRM domain-containing protein n=1 Tax=Cacopsylla melanoneura TaxID=428564 RepID=A0A8D8RG80_9HEMI
MADTSSPVEEGGATHGGGDLKRKLDETLTPGEREGNELGEKKIKEEEEKVESGGDGGGAKHQSEEKEKGDDACFAYSKRGDFTSEVFKIIVKGLPAFFGIGEVRKHFEVFLNVRVCKVIPVNRNPHRSRSKPGGVFVTFYDEATRQMALEKLNGYRYKGQVLTAVVSVTRVQGTSVDCSESQCHAGPVHGENEPREVGRGVETAGGNLHRGETEGHYHTVVEDDVR